MRTVGDGNDYSNLVVGASPYREHRGVACRRSVERWLYPPIPATSVCCRLHAKGAHFEWVPPGGSPIAAGMRHTLFTAAFGWWSIMGWMITPAIIINNLLGGIDVTRVLAGDQPDEAALAVAYRDLERSEKRQQAGGGRFVVAHFSSNHVLLVVRFVQGGNY